MDTIGDETFDNMCEDLRNTLGRLRDIFDELIKYNIELQREIDKQDVFIIENERLKHENKELKQALAALRRSIPMGH